MALRPSCVYLLLWALVALRAQQVESFLQRTWARRENENPYSRVEAQAFQVKQSTLGGRAEKYLLASFPKLRQVAYCHLPDNVWRPLVLGSDVGMPTSIVVDTQSGRLFVADPTKQVIWWYQLVVREGFLETSGHRHAAVQNVTACWLAVNSIGDLYLTGRRTDASTSYYSVFRQDAKNLLTGNSLGAVEVYTHTNTGSPDPKVWRPSGVAVDSLFVYWGNEEGGGTHGSVVKGSRTNIGLSIHEQRLEVLSSAVEQVTAMTSTGTHIFYTAPRGVYGVLKTKTASPVDDPNAGLIATGPVGENDNATWSPTGIVWDGDNTLYFTETSQGAVYMLPALNQRVHTLTKQSDAPGIHDVALIAFASEFSASPLTPRAHRLCFLIVTLLSAAAPSVW